MISSTISFSSLAPSSPPPPHTYHLHPEYLVPQIFISHSSSFFQRRARRRVAGWELVGQSQATTISREVLPHVGPRWTTKCSQLILSLPRILYFLTNTSLVRLRISSLRPCTFSFWEGSTWVYEISRQNTMNPCEIYLLLKRITSVESTLLMTTLANPLINVRQI